MGDFYNGGLWGKSFSFVGSSWIYFVPGYIKNMDTHCESFSSKKKNSNKKVISKKRLTNLYEINSRPCITSDVLQNENCWMGKHLTRIKFYLIYQINYLLTSTFFSCFDLWMPICQTLLSHPENRFYGIRKDLPLHLNMLTQKNAVYATPCQRIWSDRIWITYIPWHSAALNSFFDVSWPYIQI